METECLADIEQNRIIQILENEAIYSLCVYVCLHIRIHVCMFTNGCDDRLQIFRVAPGRPGIVSGAKAMERDEKIGILLCF